jgi:hypothetical protein
LPHVPLVEVRVMVQSIPAGCEVTRPSPVPPRASETLPFEARNAVVTVIVEDLVTPPAVAMIVEDVLLVTVLVATVNVALVDPAGTVTLGGTVAAAVLLLDSETAKPPDGAAEVRVTVPVAGSGPTIVVGLTLSADSDGDVDGGGVELAVQPDRRAEVGVVDPSLTSTVQSAGLVNGSLSILKLPEPSLVVIATPSTVIVRLAIPRPSMRSFDPLTSAREMLTVASATGAATATSAITAVATSVCLRTTTREHQRMTATPCQKAASEPKPVQHLSRAGTAGQRDIGRTTRRASSRSSPHHRACHRPSDVSRTYSASAASLRRRYSRSWARRNASYAASDRQRSITM